MAKKLWQSLQDCGCTCSADRFREICVEELEKFALDNGWTGDELMAHPSVALQYVQAVRVRLNCAAVPEEIICRTPINIRRRGGGQVNLSK